MLRNSFSRGVVVCFATTWVVCTAAGPLFGADPTLEEITQALKDWRSSWITLHVEWERRSETMLHRLGKSGGMEHRKSLDDYYLKEHWYIPGDGGMRRETWNIDYGVPKFGWQLCLNARTGVTFETRFKADKTGTPRMYELKIRPGGGGLTASNPRYSPEWPCFPMIPLGTSRMGYKDLTEALSDGQGILEGFEGIDGVRCARVRIECEEPTKFGVLLWLDPEHDWLPRRMDVSGEVVDQFWEVHEFQRLSNGRWFPRAGVERPKPEKRYTVRYDAKPEDYDMLWKVTEITINETFDPKVFTPPKPENGTSVQNQLTGFYGVWGVDNKPGTVRETEIVEQAREAAKPTDTVTATPWSSLINSHFVLLTFAVLALASGWWLSRRG